MKRTILVSLLAVGFVTTAWLVSTALAGSGKWLGKTARVTEIIETHHDPCKPHVDDSRNGNRWNLEVGKSKFQVKKKLDKAYGVKRVQPNLEDPDIEVPDYYVFNKSSSWLKSSACDNEKSLKGYPFGFAMHMMRDPQHPENPKTPHGLLLVPVEIKTADPKVDRKEFYLLIYSFPETGAACTAPYLERCRALAALWKMQPTATEKEMRRAILDNIDVIRPPISSSEINVRYHNGVIHGNL